MASHYIGTRNVGSIALLHAANMPLMWQSDSARAVRELTAALEKLQRQNATPDQKRYSKSIP